MTYVYRYYFGKRKKYGRIFNEEIGCQKLDMRVDEYMGPFVSGNNLNFFLKRLPSSKFELIGSNLY